MAEEGGAAFSEAPLLDTTLTTFGRNAITVEADAVMRCFALGDTAMTAPQGTRACHPSSLKGSTRFRYLQLWDVRTEI